MLECNMKKNTGNYIADSVYATQYHYWLSGYCDPITTGDEAAVTFNPQNYNGWKGEQSAFQKENT